MNSVLREYFLSNGFVFQLVQGDITKEKVDAIVNAANKSLQHGGGVAWVIAKQGGRIIQEQSDAWIAKYGEITHENPAFTDAGALPCKYVIHAVGPIWGEGNEHEKLATAILGVLHLAEKLNLSSLSFPAISTGIYGFPKEPAARIFYQTIPAYFNKHKESNIHLVRLVLYDRKTIAAFLKVWDEMYKPPTDQS